MLFGKSKAFLSGKIVIPPSSCGVDSYLDEHLLLLSSQARAKASPSLEISNNDVKASHSSSVEEIDLEKLFYLQSRGISKEESKQTLIESFLFPGLEDEELKKVVFK